MSSTNPSELETSAAFSDVFAAEWTELPSAKSVARRVNSSAGVQSPTRPSGATEAQSREQHSWWRSTLRHGRNALLGLLLIGAVPFAFIERKAPVLYWGQSGVTDRLAAVEPLRALRTPAEETLTPLQAGQLLAAVLPRKADVQFPTPATAPTDVAMFQPPVVPDGLFESLRLAPHRASMNPGLDHLLIITAAGSGFSPAELAHLESVAHDEVWSVVDQVSAAQSLDLLGGAFEQPFRSDAFSLAMPDLPFSRLRELAYANASRAAYFVATGKPDEAERALRSVLSLGFLLIDNGTSTIDAIMGAVIAGIARDGLHQLYGITGNEPGLALTAQPAPPGRVAESEPVSLAEQQQQLVATASNGALPRTVRQEALTKLSLSPCGSARGTLLGMDADVQALFSRPDPSLARFPSEREYLQLLSETVVRLPPEAWGDVRLPERVLMGAATVAATVLQNPRVETCTRMATLLR
jgi:hypothetical protein